MREFDQQLLASFADLSEARLAEGLLESEGIPCRVGDLDQLPAHALTGGLGMLGRSSGIWVLAQDLERASVVIADLRRVAVDPEALAEEAVAAAAEPATDGPAVEKTQHRALRGVDPAASRFSPQARILAWLFIVATALALVGRLW